MNKETINLLIGLLQGVVFGFAIFLALLMISLI